MENMTEYESRRINRRIYYENTLSTITTCGCGATVTYSGKMSHLKSKRHQMHLGIHPDSPKYRLIVNGKTTQFIYHCIIIINW